MFIRRLLNFRNSSESALSAADLQTVPCYYLGQTFACQPSPDELRRAESILGSRHRKELDKGSLPIYHAHFEKDIIKLKDVNEANHKVYDIRRIVVCCVYAKNQRVLAIFYHGNNAYIGSAVSSGGLECHLFLTKHKEVARLAANKISHLLAGIYNEEASVESSHLESGALHISRSQKPSDDDIDYDSIQAFFRKNYSPTFRNDNASPLSITPAHSDSTFVTSSGSEMIMNSDPVTRRQRQYNSEDCNGNDISKLDYSEIEISLSESTTPEKKLDSCSGSSQMIPDSPLFRVCERRQTITNKDTECGHIDPSCLCYLDQGKIKHKEGETLPLIAFDSEKQGVFRTPSNETENEELRILLRNCSETDI